MNSFGDIFRLTTFGESHGCCVGGVIDGCPAGMPVDYGYLREQLCLRSPESVVGGTARTEPDEVEFLSGLLDGVTTGTPIAFVVKNRNVRSGDYADIEHIYRPGHADYTYRMRYGMRDARGGGRASARETVVRVVAGALAKMWLRTQGVAINGYVSQVGDIALDKPYSHYDLPQAKQSPLRCPDSEAEMAMKLLIERVQAEGDSIGGMVTCVVSGVPAGVGEPMYDKLDAQLASAMLSIPAVKGFDIGHGMNVVRMRGSENNDAMVSDGKEVRFLSNNAGGVLGGISTGEDIYFRVAFKPVSSIGVEQQSVTDELEDVRFSIKGRHDVCVAPRAVAVVEAMAAIVIMNQMLYRRVSL